MKTMYYGYPVLTMEIDKVYGSRRDLFESAIVDIPGFDCYFWLQTVSDYYHVTEWKGKLFTFDEVLSNELYNVKQMQVNPDHFVSIDTSAIPMDLNAVILHFPVFSHPEYLWEVFKKSGWQGAANRYQSELVEWVVSQPQAKNEAIRLYRETANAVDSDTRMTRAYLRIAADLLFKARKLTKEEFELFS
jgi:hypothetical protein